MITRTCGRIAAKLAVAASSASSTVFAQSCAMCYTSAAASGASGIKAIQLGILVLLFPPLLIFVGICIAVFRRHRREELSHDVTVTLPG
jgi:hypothetical protein